MYDQRNYTITHVENFSPIPWDTVPSLSIDTFLWMDPVPITASAKICYDEDQLHVFLTATESIIRAEETSVTGMPCLDSCLEFFFCPMEQDLRYFNIEFNLNCCMYLGFGGKTPDQHIRLLPGRQLFSPKAARTADGWSVTYSVPFSFIRHFFPDFEVYSGKKIRANCYKCGDLTVQEHYIAWNPINFETPRFHKPDDFGIMIFE